MPRKLRTNNGRFACSRCGGPATIGLAIASRFAFAFFPIGREVYNVVNPADELCYSGAPSSAKPLVGCGDPFGAGSTVTAAAIRVVMEGGTEMSNSTAQFAFVLNTSALTGFAPLGTNQS